MNNLHDIRNSKKRKTALRKERIIMLSASAFVLAALTMTGIYVREKDKTNNDEYRVDLDELNQMTVPDNTSEVAEELVTAPVEQITYADDLDADPYFQETNSSEIENPQFPKKTDEIKSEEVIVSEDEAESESESEVTQSEPESPTEPAESTQETAAPVAVNYVFPTEQVLHLPANGDILMNYSMDKTVYHKTLGQYRYNPAVVISATCGDRVDASTTGIVKTIKASKELGNYVVLDIGEGYELTYGQLKDICVTEGQVVEAGQTIGNVAEPSIFYSAEGCNLYFKLTHNQVPDNPLAYMQ